MAMPRQDLHIQSCVSQANSVDVTKRLNPHCKWSAHLHATITSANFISRKIILDIAKPFYSHILYTDLFISNIHASGQVDRAFIVLEISM